ncbi:MAG TPA: hypothetical protein VKD67_05415 [Acidimicrobiales bacterium]|nr:hypothetical protein [Acidimicrobiales bacterium]
MADEGSPELHEPWASHPAEASAPPETPVEAEPPAPPRPPGPYDVEAESPTTELPAVPPPPLAFAPPPPPPPADKGKKWPGSAKATVIILALALLGAAGGLGYAWWKTNEDKKDLEKVTTAQGQELTSQLDKANADLNTTKSSLDAANKQITDLQGQLKTAQDQAAANKAQADALKALFPVTASSVAGGLPGTYNSPSVGPVAGACSVAPCPNVQLTLTIESTSGALSVSNPALGRVPLQAGSGGWTATGPVLASLQLQCAGSPQTTTFVLSLAPAAVALDAKNAAQVTSLAGSLVLTSPAVSAPPPPPGGTPGASCAPGVATYNVVANRT